ncbi:MAG: sigma 54-interacting transcriptional regulator [Proteobacteria bacterium]|nr:sigma 54-interacting transcriptional regulator [Pseudomonadota bacterium]
MTVEVPRSATNLASCHAQLAVVAGPDVGYEQQWSIPEVRIGTASDCDVVLTDPTVSATHCVIRSDPYGASIHDLGSTNGTHVGGYRVTSAYLKPGSLIRLGNTEIYLSVSSRGGNLDDDDGFGLVLGRSPAMKHLFEQVRRLASSTTTVLIEGETGTGKDLIAETIHAASSRSAGPLVVFDCAGVTPSLLNAELFGYVRGAFTGADVQRTGALESGHGGTVFFDEIGELPAELQPALLRALERREITRIGCHRARKIDVRIIAATNRSLHSEVESGRFRADLFYRLNVMTLEVPPLRERIEDIELLAGHFLRQISGDHSAAMPANIIDLFRGYHWPGNVRELRSVIERWVVFGRPKRLNTLLPDQAPQQRETSAPECASFRQAKAQAVETWEQDYLTSLLRRHHGNISRAARSVRMNRNHLAALLKRHGLT